MVQFKQKVEQGMQVYPSDVYVTFGVLSIEHI